MSTKIKLTVPTITVHAAGEDIVLKPFSFGQLGPVSQSLGVIADRLGPDGAGVGALMAAGGEELMHIVAFACGKPREWLDTIDDYDEGVALVNAVVELNKERFAKKLMPAILGLMAKLAPATKVTGIVA